MSLSVVDLLAELIIGTPLVIVPSYSVSKMGCFKTIIVMPAIIKLTSISICLQIAVQLY